MSRRWTTSPVALDWYGQARVLASQGKPSSEIESALRNALAADPRFAEAYDFLGATLGDARNVGESKKAATASLKLNPNNAFAHRLLADGLLAEGNSLEGERELQIAARLDPDTADTFARLGYLHYVAGRHRQAIDAYGKALQLSPYAPFSGFIHAHLASSYAHQGFREKALVELKAAEEIPTVNDNLVEQALVDAGVILNQLPMAIAHCKKPSRPSSASPGCMSPRRGRRLTPPVGARLCKQPT